MFIIPELRTVVIAPARTGSTSLRKRIAERWPNSLHPYRHGEWIMTPDEFKDYSAIYVARWPDNRMKSTWNYLAATSYERNCKAPHSWVDACHAEGSRDLNDWFQNSTHTFHSPTPGLAEGEHDYFKTAFTVPVNRKGVELYMAGCPANKWQAVPAFSLALDTMLQLPRENIKVNAAPKRSGLFDRASYRIFDGYFKQDFDLMNAAIQLPGHL